MDGGQRSAIHGARLFDGERLNDGPVLVLVDYGRITDVDFTGAQALGQALDELERDGVPLVIARVGDHLRDNLTRSGLLARIGADHVYASVDEAVSAAAAPA